MKPELVDHRKFLRLKRLLGEPTPHVLGYLLLMWRRGYQTGNPLLGDALDVEAAAEYQGEPRKFATAALQSGFLDRDDDEETFRIHDLWEHAPEWAKKRMARCGFLPDDIKEYSGIKPKIRRTASKTPNQTPRGVQNSETDAARHVEDREKKKEVKEEKKDSPPLAAGGRSKPKVPDPIFDALVEVTGSDPKLNAAHIGRVRKGLLAADPPYSPSEILRMADPEFQTRELKWKTGEKLTLGEVEKFISRTRNPSHANRPNGAGAGRDLRGDAPTFDSRKYERLNAGTAQPAVAVEGQPSDSPAGDPPGAAEHPTF